MFTIPEEIAEKLERVAAIKNQTVVELLEDFVGASSELKPNASRNFIAELAAAAKAANLKFDEPDVASRSRELLERDFANDIDYRTRRE